MPLRNTRKARSIWKNIIFEAVEPIKLHYAYSSRATARLLQDDETAQRRAICAHRGQRTRFDSGPCHLPSEERS
jgi:hypothetical protein